jgi:hypothetical protein
VPEGDSSAQGGLLPPVRDKGNFDRFKPLLLSEDATGMKFGKITAVPEMITGANPDADPLRTMVNPCDRWGIVVDTTTTWGIYRRWRYNILKGDAPPIPHHTVGDVIAFLPLDGTLATRQWRNDQTYADGEIVWYTIGGVKKNFESLANDNAGNVPTGNESDSWWGLLGGTGLTAANEGIMVGEGWILPANPAPGDYRKPIQCDSDGTLKKGWLEFHAPDA